MQVSQAPNYTPIYVMTFIDVMKQNGVGSGATYYPNYFVQIAQFTLLPKFEQKVQNNEIRFCYSCAIVFYCHNQ